jgi:hypothetical protein
VAVEVDYSSASYAALTEGLKFDSSDMSCLRPVDWIVAVALFSFVICGLVYFMIESSLWFEFPVHPAAPVVG